MKPFKVLLFLLVTFSSQVQSLEIKICSDRNFWYPFSFVSNGNSSGLHVSITNQALADTGHTYIFKPLEWGECLAAARKGEFDAVMSASYKKERAEYLYYPADAELKEKSDFRVTQVEYVVVSRVGSSYEFNGDVTTLPQPVRAPVNYSIVDDMQKAGVKVTTSKSDIVNLKKLLKSGEGVVVTLPEIANRLGQGRSFKNQLKIHSLPIKSKSYYLAFSKKSMISGLERMQIWVTIAKVRENEVLVNSFLDELQ